MPRTPVQIVAGPLGVGKTTALLALFRHRPPGERWAVVVNEFGSVGIDGAVLSADGSVAVKEIAGGCVCCVAGPALRAAIVQILRQVKPDRLFVEPTGLAHPAAIIDLLRSPGIAEAVELRATIVLVDPHRMRPRDPFFLDVLQAADVLVANRADLASEAELAAFRAFADGLWPPPTRVLTTELGVLPADVLELAPGPARRITVPHAARPLFERGWIWPPDTVFDGDRLTVFLQRLVRPGHPALPGGVERAKGIFHTERGWWLVNATAERLKIEPVGWRRDSRFEVLVPEPGRWEEVENGFSAVIRGEGPSTLV